MSKIENSALIYRMARLAVEAAKTQDERREAVSRCKTARKELIARWLRRATLNPANLQEIEPLLPIIENGADHMGIQDFDKIAPLFMQGE